MSKILRTIGVTLRATPAEHAYFSRAAAETRIPGRRVTLSEFVRVAAHRYAEELLQERCPEEGADE